MDQQLHTTANPFPRANQEAGFHTDPFDVVEDPGLTRDQKRELLASWASDARAVENAPALRRLDSGALVDIDSILAALKRLDGDLDQPPVARRNVAVLQPTARRRHNLPFRLHRRLWGRRSDDDDDPPPCPAAALPPRPMPSLEGAATAAAA